MARVLEPLARLGAKALARPGGRLPLTLSGPAVPKATAHSLGVASAQVKSALLLASLRAQGEVVLTLPQATRDHTERLLALAGVEVEVERTAQGGERVAMQAPQSLKPFEMSVPGDISAAAFPLVAALITPGSMVELDAVSVNPTRTGLLDALQAMGAALRVEGEDTGKPGEPSATLTAQASSLEGIDWPGEHVALMVDEYPVLAAACALARGRSRLRGLAELRVKESDRLTGTAALINACGGTAWVEEDDLLIDGTGGEPLPGGAVVEADGDHRMAMSACVLGLACRAAVTVTGAEAVATSWPGFVTAMQSLGADLAEIGP
jgi:3-phosphoshikimate 1-carboxyvinyltransferase